jgi:drug/metabolite transporter (DMT)-like permease
MEGMIMHWSRILGIALLVGGVILLFMGWSASESLTEDLSQTLTGRYTEDTRNYLLGGGVAAAVGVVLLVFGARR